MASNKTTVDFILDQIAAAGAVSAKKMFGEYGIYCDAKIVALCATTSSLSRKQMLAENCSEILWKAALSLGLNRGSLSLVIYGMITCCSAN